MRVARIGRNKILYEYVSLLCKMTEKKHKHASRHQAVEPIIGYLKSDHRLERCYLRGQTGDTIHKVLCAAGYNITWFMRMILKKVSSLICASFLPKKYRPCLRI